MARLLGAVSGILFFALSVLIVGWTAWHTYDVLYKTNPIQGNELVAAYGLIVFEGGMLVWFGVFLKHAEGLKQHAIALLGLVCGVVLVAAAFILDMVIAPETLAGYGSMARWAVVVATVLELVFVLTYEIMNPAVWDQLTQNINVADILDKADSKAKTKIEQSSGEIADQIAEHQKETAFARALEKGIVSKKEAKTETNGHKQKEYTTTTPESVDSKNVVPPRP